jgi:hypothetical protein
VNDSEKIYEQETSRKWSTERSGDFHGTGLRFCHGPLPRLARWARAGSGFR